MNLVCYFKNFLYSDWRHLQIGAHHLLIILEIKSIELMSSATIAKEPRAMKSSTALSGEP